jgi:enamine deaminase RidA (YjgF/YER057c/UK114 family)
MAKQEIVSAKLAEPNGHFAQAVVAEARGRLLFISGMTARNAEGGITGLGDITAQTRQVCENLRAAVEEAGGTMDDIVRVDVYVTDMRHFDAIHAVRRDFFTGTPPASTMVEISKFSRPGYEIEMNAIAVLP